MSTAETVARMREQRAGGMTIAAIAAEHGVSTSTVRRRTTGVRAGRPAAGTRTTKTAETAEMWGLWVSGVTQATLAERYGLSQAAVSERFAVYRRSLPETERETIFRRELDLLDDIRRRLLLFVYDASAEPAVRLAAMDRVLKGQERLAKMLGLDATPGVNVDATVRYVIEGVDPAAHR